MKTLASTFFLMISLLVLATPALAVPAGPVVGKITAVLGDVSGVDQDGDAIAAVTGGDVHAGFIFTTGDRSYVRVEMSDGTTFSLGEDGSASIEQFEFDPGARTGRFVASVAQGGVEYISGQIGTYSSTREHSTITTPHAVLGIRGSRLVISVRNLTVTRVDSGVITLTNPVTGVSRQLAIGTIDTINADGTETTFTIDNAPSNVLDLIGEVLDENVDTDGDGIPNTIDTDDDGDGISDDAATDSASVTGTTYDAAGEADSTLSGGGGASPIGSQPVD